MQVGTRVRIRQDSKYANQNDGEGAVVVSESAPGWVRVKFDNHQKNNYRTGQITGSTSMGVCDLELVGQSQLPTIVTVEMKVKNGMKIFGIEIPADHRVQPVGPGDIIKIDLLTMQIAAD